MVKITMHVEGMMCGHCEAHVNDAIRSAFDIKSVSSSHRKNETVIIAAEDIDKEKLKSFNPYFGIKRNNNLMLFLSNL